mgnify:CR=1 FL=1
MVNRRFWCYVTNAVGTSFEIDRVCFQSCINQSIVFLLLPIFEVPNSFFKNQLRKSCFLFLFPKVNNGSPMDGLSHLLLITVTYKLLSIKARIHWFVWLLDNHRNLRKIHIWQFFSKLSATNLWKVGRMFNVAIGKFCKYLTNLDMIAIREKINMN